jgi:putative endopeptidase
LALKAVMATAAAAGSGLDTQGFESTVRFQDNLFLATNGGWLNSTEIPADKSWYGTIPQLREIADQRVHAIIDGLAKYPHKPGSLEQKLGDFYASFLDTETIDQAGRSPIEPVLAEIDAIASLHAPGGAGGSCPPDSCPGAY